MWIQVRWLYQKPTDLNQCFQKKGKNPGSTEQGFRHLNISVNFRVVHVFAEYTSFVDLLCFCSVLCLLCLCASLFICALWSPAGKGLTSWLSFVVSNCEFVTFQLVSWVGCGT